MATDTFTSFYDLVLRVSEQGMAAVEGSQKKMRDAVASGERGWTAAASTATKANSTITVAANRTAEAVARAGQRTRDGAKLQADAWSVAAKAAADADAKIAESAAAAAAEVDKAAQKEIAALRAKGMSYREIADEALKSDALRRRSAEETAAVIRKAAQDEVRGIREPPPTIGGRLKSRAADLAGFAGRTASGLGTLALGGFGAAAGLTYMGIKQAEQLGRSSLMTSGITGMNQREAASTAVLAQTMGLNPRQMSVMFATLGGQATKAFEGKKTSVEAFEHLGITKGQATADKNNLPALFDLVFQHAQKLPGAERASMMRTMLGRGAAMGGVIESRGSLASQVKHGEVGLPDPKTLAAMHDQMLTLKETMLKVELAFAAAFGPTLIKLLKAVTPLLMPLGNLLAKGVGGGIKLIGDLIKGPIGKALEEFGKKVIKAGEDLFKSFAPAMPFLKNVLLPLLKGIAAGVGIALLGAIKLLSLAMKGLAPVLGFIGNLLKPFKHVIEDIGKVIGIVFSGEIIGAIGSLGKAADAIPGIGKVFGVLGDAVSAVGGIFAKVFGIMPAIVRAGVGVVTMLFSNFHKAITDTIGTVVSFIGEHWKLIVPLLTGPFAPIVALILNFHKQIASAFETLFNVLKNVVTVGWKAITDVFNAVVKAISEAVKTVLDFIGEHWKQLVPLLTGPFAPVLEIILNFGPQILGAIKSAFDDVVKFLEGLPGEFLNLGKSIVKGLVHGIEAAPKAIIDAVKKLIPGPLQSVLKGAEGVIGEVAGIFGRAGGYADRLPHFEAGGFVPGSPHRDGTLALLSGREFVMTGHGQEMMETHAPGLLEHIAANQLPHFATGGWTIQERSRSGRAKKPEKVNTYFDSKTGQTLHMTAKEHSEYTRHQAESKYAANTRVVTASEFGGHNDPSAFNKPTASGAVANDTLWGFAELSNPPGSLNFSALGDLPMGTKLTIKLGNRTTSVPKVDKGKGGPGIGGHVRAMDLTYAVARAMGFPMGGMENIQVTGLANVKVGPGAKGKAPKVLELTGKELAPADAFSAAFEAGMKGEGLGASGLIEQVVASVKTALKSQVETEGGGGSSGLGVPGTSKGGQNPRVAAMLAAGRKIAGLPYIYGGGHGSFSSTGYDCSGAVSYVLHAAGLLSRPITTDGLKAWGLPGDGKLVTVGVWGSTGENAHTMMDIAGHYFESGGAGGKGPHWDSGWSQSFPIRRHPPGLRRGGYLPRFRSGGGPARGGKPAAARVDPRYNWLKEGGADLWEPRSKGFLGWGLRRGGWLPRLRVGGRAHARSSRRIGARPSSTEVLVELPNLEEVQPTTDVRARRLLAHTSAVTHAMSGIASITGAAPSADVNAQLEELGTVLDNARTWVQEQLTGEARKLEAEVKRLRARHASSGKLRPLEAKLRAYQDAIDGAQDVSIAQLERMARVVRGQEARAKQRGADAIVIRRFQATLDLLEGAVGNRLGQMVRRIQDSAATIAAGATGTGGFVEQHGERIVQMVGGRAQVVRLARRGARSLVGYQVQEQRLGIAQGSAQALSADILADQTAIPQYQAQIKALEAARAKAKAHHSRKAVAAIDAQIDAIQQSITNATTDLMVKQQELIMKQAQDRVTQATHGQTMAQGAVQILEAQQGARAGTPEALRAQAAAMSGTLGSQQGVLAALQAQEGALAGLASQGNTTAAEQLLQVQEQIQQQQLAILQTQNQAAEKLMQAATAQVQAAQTHLQGAQLLYGHKKLEEELHGTTATSGPANAEFIKDVVIPAAQQVVNADLEKIKTDTEQGASPQQLEEDKNKLIEDQNTILQLQVEEQKAIKENTSKMVDAAGSLGFSFQGQDMTDLINVGVGA